MATCKCDDSRPWTVGELRPEMIAVAPKLAAEIVVAGLGLTPIRICPMAGHTGFTRVEIEAEIARRAKGRRMWFSTRRQAEKVIREMLSDRRSRRSGAGLIIEAGPDEAERLIIHFGHLNGYQIIDHAEVEAIKVRVASKIDATLHRMKAAGALAQLNHRYKALPAPRPSYNAFLAKELRVSASLDPADARSLLARL